MPMKRNLQPAVTALALLGVALAAAPIAIRAQSQDKAGDSAAARLAAAANEVLETERATQERLDDWAAERTALQARWDAAQAQVRYLEERTALQRGRVEALEAAGRELARRLEESQRLETSLEDTLLAILGRLEEAVERDLPFLEQERARRMTTVRRELGDPAASAADKLRRVLEAVLIEARYGGAFEIYQERIAVGAEELTSDLLYVGRLGLFWLTPDAARGGMWDPAAAAFIELQGRELDAVRRAVEMASRRRPAGVQALPLGRVAP
jgi:hypothetical protein